MGSIPVEDSDFSLSHARVMLIIIFHLTSVYPYCKLCASAFYHLYNKDRIRKFFKSSDATKALVHAFVTSCEINKVPRYCYDTPFLRELHWLPVRQRIDYKILLLTKPFIIYRRREGWVILGGDLNFLPLKKGGPGVTAELWRGALKF